MCVFVICKMGQRGEEKTGKIGYFGVCKINYGSDTALV